MFTIFFNSQGPVAVDIMPDKTTITATYYTTSVLPKVIPAYPVNSTDSKAVSNPVASRQCRSSQSSPHPDVPGSKLYPFDGISTIRTRRGPMRLLALSKNQIKHCWEAFFKDPRPCQTVYSEIRAIPVSEYCQCFEKWRMRMQRCIEVEGSYFEGM